MAENQSLIHLSRIGSDACSPRPAGSGQSFLERLPTEVHLMIFDRSNGASRHALVQVSSKLRSAGWNYRLRHIKLKDTLEFLEADLLMMTSHPSLEVVRTKTTSLNIVITNTQHREGAARPKAFNTQEAVRQLTSLVVLVSKMKQLRSLKIRVDRREIDESLWKGFQEAVCFSFEALGNRIRCKKVRVVLLRGFTTPRVMDILACFPNVQRVQLDSLCLEYAQPYPHRPLCFKGLQSLMVDFSPRSMGSVGQFFVAAHLFPNVKSLVIGCSRWSNQSHEMEFQAYLLSPGSEHLQEARHAKTRKYITILRHMGLWKKLS
ncbi:hypothetical protein F4774DRAFT_429058 [Daldinia eschscholtzii]|nr:hypothetical protein F4774DRAFT_429058 [Daldinia eschscholtzii]